MEKATYYWSRGWLDEKMQAIRIAGHVWGKDVDAELENGSGSDRETDYDAIENFFMSGGMAGT